MDVEALFKQYYPRLRNYATRFVGNIFVAEDIVQECFIKLYEKRFSLAEVSPGALLFVMVRNSCLNYMKRKIFAETGTPFYVAADITPEDDLMYEELRIEIERVMQKHQRTRHPRTAIALTENNHFIMFVVDGRNSNSDGMSARELTQFMVKWFNPQYALNMDGGGSSTLCVEGEGDQETHVVNYPCDNNKYDHAGERARATHFIVVEN
jgi:RNA polymerase sigma factor (sigma-70 family)